MKTNEMIFAALAATAFVAGFMQPWSLALAVVSCLCLAVESYTASRSDRLTALEEKLRRIETEHMGLTTKVNMALKPGQGNR